jgi:hypothetical protein
MLTRIRLRRKSKRGPLCGDVPRQEFGDAIDRMFGDALEDMPEVSLRVEVVEFGSAEAR